MSDAGARALPWTVVTACVVAGAGLAGCAAYRPAPAFDPRFPDNRPDALTAFAAGAAPAPPNPAPALGVDGQTGELLAYGSLGAPARWRSPEQPATRPVLAGDLVLFASGKGSGRTLVALDSATGRPRWRRPLDTYDFIGAAPAGQNVVVVESRGAQGGRHRDGRVLALDTATGATRWSRGTRGILGRPVRWGDVVAVPWDRQSLALLDPSTGVERARLRLTDDVLAWIREEVAGVTFGSERMYLLGAGSAAGSRDAMPNVALRTEGLPGLPRVEPDAFHPLPAERSARGRIRLAAAVETDGLGGLRLVGNRVYFLYFRHVYAFDSAGQVRWAAALATEAIDAVVRGEGLLVVEASGAAQVFDDRDGERIWWGSTGGTLASVTLPPALDLSAPRADAPVVPRIGTLRSALRALAFDPDNRLLPSRALAVKLLAGLDAPDVTADLLELYAAPSTPVALRRVIEASMATRTAGLELAARALEPRFDFLEGTAPPPFALLLPVLVAGARRDVVPLLARHLEDASTPQADLRAIVEAMHALGGATVVAPLWAFLTRYRADSAFAADAAPLSAAARAIFALGTDEDRARLARLGARRSTHATLAGAIEAEFADERMRAAALAEAEAKAKARAEREAAERAAREAPEQLSPADLEATFGTRVAGLRTCIAGELARRPNLARVRWTFVVERDGHGRDYHFAPASPEFAECMGPVVSGLTFPRFRRARQAASFSVAIRDPRRTPPPTPYAPDPSAPWWERERSRYFASLPADRGAVVVPWWIPKHPPVARPASADAPDETPWWVPIEDR